MPKKRTVEKARTKPRYETSRANAVCLAIGDCLNVLESELGPEDFLGTSAVVSAAINEIVDNFEMEHLAKEKRLADNRSDAHLEIMALRRVKGFIEHEMPGFSLQQFPRGDAVRDGHRFTPAWRCLRGDDPRHEEWERRLQASLEVIDELISLRQASPDDALRGEPVFRQLCHRLLALYRTAAQKPDAKISQSDTPAMLFVKAALRHITGEEDTRRIASYFPTK